MYNRLFILIVGVVLLAACAKPPAAELEDTRKIVAYAYAAGASQLAAEPYTLAAKELSHAEELVRQGKYREAETSLDLARNYSNQALGLTVQRKREHELEQERQAEEKRLAEERAQAELLRRQQAAAKKMAKVEKPMPKPVEKNPPEPEVKLVDQVEVAAGDDLATIAAKPEVYKDAMLWPLIYKANRDQIKDPKEIFAGQLLLVPRDKSAEEVEAARQEAKDLNLF